MGAVFAPMNTLAMRRVTVQMAGAASGVIGLARQFGAVLGGAAVGALLQSQLASKITDEATTRAGELPADMRDGFVSALQSVADGTGSFSPLYAIARLGLPAAQRGQVNALASEVFGQGFVDALHPTLLLPIITLLAAAALCLLLSKHDATPAGPEQPVPADAADRPAAAQQVR
jgi:hypothetical protein